MRMRSETKRIYFGWFHHTKFIGILTADVDMNFYDLKIIEAFSLELFANSFTKRLFPRESGILRANQVAKNNNFTYTEIAQFSVSSKF